MLFWATGAKKDILSYRSLKNAPKKMPFWATGAQKMIFWTTGAKNDILSYRGLKMIFWDKKWGFELFSIKIQLLTNKTCSIQQLWVLFILCGYLLLGHGLPPSISRLVIQEENFLYFYIKCQLLVNIIVSLQNISWQCDIQKR